MQYPQAQVATPSASALPGRSKAGEKAESMGTMGDMFYHSAVALQAGWEICVVLSFTKPWGQSVMAI